MVAWGTSKAERRTTAAVLGALAGLTACWWLALVASPAVRRWFELDGDRPEVLSAFVLADLIVVAGGSGVAAVGVARGWRPASAIVAWTAGGWAYATLLVAAWVGSGGDGAIGLVPMVVATALVSFVAWRRATAS